MTQNKSVALIILDGFGLREERHANAVEMANKPNFDRYWNAYAHTKLTACGEAVGLPEGQMGNSEVGHLNIGAGRTVYQDLTRINKAIKDGEFTQNDVLKQAIEHVKKKGKALHLYGLVSDGGVHSHIQHLFALLDMAKQQDVKQVYVHAFTDGRDVSPDSGKAFIKQLLNKMNQLGLGQLATIQGRYYAMDRDKRWDRVEKSYRAMVYGDGKPHTDPLQAMKESYDQAVYDEFIQPIIMTHTLGDPVGTIQTEDAVVCFNFRPDRSIQISQAMTGDDFEGFDRGDKSPRDLHYVCLTPYSETIEAHIAYQSTDLKNTLGEVLAQHGRKQLRIAETEKYPHVTFFFNGGREQPFPGEKRVLINSPQVATYDLQPEMSIYELTDALIKEINADTHDVIILNFANPDMVGHSGKIEPTIKAVEAVDECLGRVVEQLLAKDGVALITADHGNADQLRDDHDQPHTAHTTNPVPLIVTQKGLQLNNGGVLADLAPTMLALLHIKKPEQMTGESLIK